MNNSDSLLSGIKFYVDLTFNRIPSQLTNEMLSKRSFLQWEGRNG